MSKLQVNLLLVNKLVSSGLKVHFNVDGCIVCAPSGEFIARVPRKGNLHQIMFSKVYIKDVTNKA